MKQVLFLSLKSNFEVKRLNPARPGPTVTLFDGLFKLLHNINTGLQIVVLKFNIVIFMDSEVIVVFGTPDFCHFYVHFCAKLYVKMARSGFPKNVISSESIKIAKSNFNTTLNHWMFSKSDYLTWKNVWWCTRITVCFILSISFMRYTMEFLGQIDWFSPYFLGKLGKGGLNMNDLSSLSSNTKSLLWKKKLFHCS